MRSRGALSVILVTSGRSHPDSLKSKGNHQRASGDHGHLERAAEQIKVALQDRQLTSAHTPHVGGPTPRRPQLSPPRCRVCPGTWAWHSGRALQPKLRSSPETRSARPHQRRGNRSPAEPVPTELTSERGPRMSRLTGGPSLRPSCKGGWDLSPDFHVEK